MSELSRLAQDRDHQAEAIKEMMAGAEPKQLQDLLAKVKISMPLLFFPHYNCLIDYGFSFLQLLLMCFRLRCFRQKIWSLSKSICDRSNCFLRREVSSRTGLSNRGSSQTARQRRNLSLPHCGKRSLSAEKPLQPYHHSHPHCGKHFQKSANEICMISTGPVSHGLKTPFSALMWIKIISMYV